MDLAELLQWLSQGQKTGTLVIHLGVVEKRIFFRDGRIISSASTDPMEYLGHFLVSRGLIDDATLSTAVKLQDQRTMMLGSILVDLGALAVADLNRMLRLKAEESIYDIFSWSEGEFRFLDGELPSHEMVPLSLDVTGIVLEGGRRLDEWRRIRATIPNGSAIPVAVGPLDTYEDDEPGAENILALVDDDRTVDEIAIEAHASEFLVCKVLHEQVQRQRLKIIKPRGAVAASTAITAAGAGAAAAAAPGRLDPATPEALVRAG